MIRALILRVPVLLSIPALLTGCGACVSLSAPPSDAGLDPVIKPSLTFRADYASVTAGHEVTLSWTTEDAIRLELFQDGERVPLDVIDVEEGSIALRVTSDVELALLASSSTKPCHLEVPGGHCALETLRVAAFPAASAVFEPRTQIVDPGVDATVALEVEDGANVVVSAVVLAGGQRTLLPCAAPGSTDARCTVDLRADERSAVGTVTVPAIDGPLTLVVTAEGLAEDGRGDLRDADVQAHVELQGFPRVLDFTLDDDTATAGGVVNVGWATANAESIEVSATPSFVEPSSLSACLAAPVEEGACALAFSVAATEGDVHLTLVAIRGGLRSAPLSRVVTLAPPPAVELNSDVDALSEGGGTVTFTYSAPGATAMRFVADTAPSPLVDTEGGVGEEVCGACHPPGGVIVVDTAVTTTYVLTAFNEYGAASASVRISVEGAPDIDSLTAGEQDLIADGTVILDAGADLSLGWSTVNAVATELSRGAPVGDDCLAASVRFDEEVFVGGSAGGNATVEQDVTLACYRLTALGGAEQRAHRIFRAVRAPSPPILSLDDDTVARNRAFALRYVAPDAAALALSVDPIGSIAQGGLDACAAGATLPEGTCQLSIQSGAPHGNVVITVEALGVIGAPSASAQVPLTVGEPPSILRFTATPSSMDAATDVTLAWTTTQGASLELLRDGVPIFTSDALEEVNAGQETVHVEATTSFRLVVRNEFSEEQRELNVFFGPSFEALTGAPALHGAEPDDGLDGRMDLPTGPLQLAWVTSNADLVELALAPVPPSGQCADVPVESYSSLGSGAAVDSFDLPGELVENRCLRATAKNLAGQESVVVAKLVEHPVAVSIDTHPAVINRAGGGTVTVSMSSFGATRMRLQVDYLNAAGGVIGGREICNQGNRSAGSQPLNDDTTPAVSICQDRYGADNSPCGGLNILKPCNRYIPAETATLRYRATFVDPEGEEAVLETDEQNDVIAE